MVIIHLGNWKVVLLRGWQVVFLYLEKVCKVFTSVCICVLALFCKVVKIPRQEKEKRKKKRKGKRRYSNQSFQFCLLFLPKLQPFVSFYNKKFWPRSLCVNKQEGNFVPSKPKQKQLLQLDDHWSVTTLWFKQQRKLW